MLEEGTRIASFKYNFKYYYKEYLILFLVLPVIVLCFVPFFKYLMKEKEEGVK